ncbi:DUF2752 domain-containing protein [Candidatus Enterococcus mansonii]|nr:DUF2752 domain-containing protein [Enterococcus sp. 4G2_DIV0659]
MNNLELCIFKHTFGVPCPGCGMTRAFIHLFHLDFKEAFYYHPLFWLVPIVFGIFLFRKKVLLFERICENKYFTAGALGLFLTVYLIRMVVLFPNTAPMDYNQHSVVARMYHWVIGLVIK